MTAVSAFVPRLWLVTLVTLAALTGTASLVGQFLPPGDQIAFMSDQSGYGWDIYLLDVNSGITHNLTHRGHNWPPIPSTPVIRYPGAALSPLNNPQMRYPAWSPDGTYLAFHANRAGSYDVYVMRADGRDVRRLTDNDVRDGHQHITEAVPSWSPDGSYLAFHADRSGDFDLYLLPIRHILDTVPPTLAALTGTAWTDVRPLITNNQSEDASLTWSPEGTRVAFVSNREGGFDIYTADLHTGRPLTRVRRLTVDDAVDLDPAWSPDGSLIAFVSQRGGNEDIYTMAVDGGDVQRRTVHPADDFNPAWTEEGDLLFASNRAGSSDLYRLDMATGTLHRLTVHPAEEQAPAWRP